MRVKALWRAPFWLTGFRHFRSNAGKAPRRILVVKLDRLGDLVLCSDFLRNLRRSYPNSEITLAVRESLADLACLSPDTDSVTPIPVDEGSMVHTGGGYYHRWSNQIFIWLGLCLASGWWSRRFDVAVIPRRDTDWYGATALAYLSGAVERFGMKQGNLLDIGCGHGTFVRAAHCAGWNAAGLDFPSKATAYAKSVLGSEHHRGRIMRGFESGKFSEARFDFVTAWHCLEHTSKVEFPCVRPNFSNPAARCYWLSPILKPMA